MMFIETAVKSIALECVLNKTGSENIGVVFNMELGYMFADMYLESRRNSAFFFYKVII